MITNLNIKIKCLTQENYNIFIHNEMAVALNLEWSQKKYKNFIEVYEKYKNNERKIPR